MKSFINFLKWEIEQRCSAIIMGIESEISFFQQ